VHHQVQKLGDVSLERLGLWRPVFRLVLGLCLIGGGHGGLPGRHFVAAEMAGTAGKFKIVAT
jgi:hypothetical protein